MSCGRARERERLGVRVVGWVWTKRGDWRGRGDGGWGEGRWGMGGGEIGDGGGEMGDGGWRKKTSVPGGVL